LISSALPWTGSAVVPLPDPPVALREGAPPAQRAQLAYRSLDEPRLPLYGLEGELARHARRAAPRVGRDRAGVVPVVHPPDRDAAPVGHVVPGDRGVEVLAVVHPAAALQDGLGGLVGEREVVRQDVAEPAGVLVDQLDLRALADEVGEVPGRPVEPFAVGARRAAHDLAADEQVDRGLGRSGYVTAS
jgi:hypothetical protein